MPPSRSAAAAVLPQHENDDIKRHHHQQGVGPRAAVAAHDRLVQYNERVTGITRQEREELIPALALRSYHLPGYSWCGDWFQYFFNNHPVIGICCHHKLHPIGMRMRFVQLIGSIMFGLCVTNCMWLYFFYHDQNGPDDPAIVISVKTGWRETDDSSTNRIIPNTTTNSLFLNATNHTSHISSIFGDYSATTTDAPTITTTTMADEYYNEIELSKMMIILWTVGGALHAIYDNTIWYLSACICCMSTNTLPSTRDRNEKFKLCGTYFVIFVTIVSTAVATFAVVVRASLEANEEGGPEEGGLGNNDLNNTMYNVTNGSNVNNKTVHSVFDDLNILQNTGLVDDDVDLSVRDASAYDFLVSYLVELTLALFVYYPVIATILFSGCLGCGGNVPMLGGRPYEVKMEEKRKERATLRKHRGSSSSNNNKRQPSSTSFS